MAALIFAIIFLPALGALVLAFYDDRAEDGMRWTGVVVTLVTMVLTFALLEGFEPNDPGIQPLYSVD
jgi:NADH:ubiquinone oxidoreductase subunit 4 (subunit M)